MFCFVFFPYLIPLTRVCAHSVAKHACIGQGRSSTQVTVQRHRYSCAFVCNHTIKMFNPITVENNVLLNISRVIRFFPFLTVFLMNVAASWTTFSRVTWWAAGALQFFFLFFIRFEGRWPLFFSFFFWLATKISRYWMYFSLRWTTSLRFLILDRTLTRPWNLACL